MPARPLIAFFKDIQKEDIPLVGGKGANLGEMANSGFPVPNGFAITVVAYDLFLGQNNLLQEVTRILKTTDHNDPQQLNHASKTIQKLILSGEIPK